MKKSKFIFIAILVFLSAGCNFNTKNLPAGVIKSVNGGADWQFSNAVKDNKSQSLVSLNISKIGFHPGQSQTVYLGSYTDGLYKSEDSGANWSKILSKIYVYDFVVNPVDPKIIYVAGLFADHGRVLKSIDGGASWNQIYNEESANNAVRAMVLNPNNVNQIIIGTNSGSVAKSADGGMSWQLVKDFNDRVSRMLWQNDSVYLVLKTKGLYKSAGFADNFVDISGNLIKAATLGMSAYSSATIDTFSQAYVDFSAPSLIYLTTNKGLYKTVDEGKTWTLLSLPVKPSASEAHAVAVSRSSSNIVYTSVGSTIYKSLDGGNNWQTQSVTTAGFINYILIDPQLPQIVYAGIYSTQ